MRAHRFLLASALAAVAALTTPATARADSTAEDRTLRWDEDVPRFRVSEYVATGILGAAGIAMYTWLPDQREPHWTGGILFDDAVRNAIRVRSPSALPTVWAFSDAVDVAVVVLAVGVDSLAVPFLRGSGDVALQLGLMDAESFAMASVVTFSLYDSIGRARPSYADCQSNPSGPGCDISPTASFPSGHAAEAYTAAGVSCANHLHVPIYGSKLLDGLACGRDLLLATADGVLRIMGDRHYATDILAGGVIGFGLGYGLPTVLHFGMSRGPRTSGWTVSPMLGSRTGLVLTGTLP